MDLEHNIERIATALENINLSLKDIASNIDSNCITGDIMGIDSSLDRIGDKIESIYNLARNRD